MFDHLTAGFIRITGGFFRPLRSREIQFQFRNRYAAGELLGRIIKKDVRNWIQDLIVLGIPKGGLMTAAAVSKILSVKLDVVVTKRLVAPYNREVTIGAVTHDYRFTYLNEELIEELKVSKEYIEYEKAKKVEEADRYYKFHFQEVESSKHYFRDKPIVLVDDGAASGATMMAAVRHLKFHKPKFLIICLPVAPAPTVQLLSNHVDKVYCIFVPESNRFKAVEKYYKDFGQLTDAEVILSIKGQQ